MDTTEQVRMRIHTIIIAIPSQHILTGGDITSHITHHDTIIVQAGIHHIQVLGIINYR